MCVVVVVMLGIFGGVGSFDLLACNMVRCLFVDALIEVWVIDCWSNFLEDLWGFDVVEVLGDVDIVWGYYFGGGDCWRGVV